MPPVLLLALAYLAYRRFGGEKKEETLNTPASAKRAAGVGRYVSRANQARAGRWVPAFMRAGATKSIAEGLARWAGIESGGDPRAKSPLGEVGLLQIMPSTAQGVFTPAEFSALTNPLTSDDTHAALALKQFRYHLSRVASYAPVPQDAESQLFYAKMHHQKPVMVQAAWKQLKAAGLKAWPHARTAAKAALPMAKSDAEKNYILAASTVGWNSEAA